MRPKVAFIIFATVLATFGHAQERVFLTFPAEGDREIWIGTGMPQAAPSESIRSRSTQVEVPVTGKADSDALFIWDQTSGNLASRTVGEVKKIGTWQVSAASYTDIAEVKVRVESGGKPVSSAQITLKDARRANEQLFDASASSDVSFYFVKPGKATVTVKYRTKQGMADPIVQTVELPLNRPEPTKTIVVAVPAGATTLDAAGSPSKPAATGDGKADKSAPADGDKAAAETPVESDAARKAKEPVPGTEPANPIGSFVVILIGLGLAGALGYFALNYAKNNSKQVQEKLEQLGVQVPKPGDNDPIPPGVPAAMPVSKPSPPQKIMLDGAAPDPVMPSSVPNPVGSASPYAAIATEPTLVGDAGDRMPLPEGETVVGREIGLGLSLAGETTVSRRHAALVRSGGQVVVKDLGSTNGTFVNGAPLQGDTPLRPGDTVQFGSVRFRYEG